MRRELLNLCVFRAWNIQPLEHEVFQKMFRYSVLKDYNFVLCFEVLVKRFQFFRFIWVHFRDRLSFCFSFPCSGNLRLPQSSFLNYKQLKLDLLEELNKFSIRIFKHVILQLVWQTSLYFVHFELYMGNVPKIMPFNKITPKAVKRQNQKLILSQIFS